MLRPTGPGLVAAGALLLSIVLPASAGDDAGYGRLEGHGGPVKGLAVSQDGRLALSASFDTSVGLWSLPEGKHLRWLEGHEAGANAVRFIGDGRALSVGDDFDLLLWNLSDGTLLERMEGHQGKVIGLAVSPDGQQVATAGWDGVIGLWSLADGSVRWLKGHTANVNDVAFSADGQRLFSASYDGTVRRWALDEAAPIPVTLKKHGFGVNHLVVDDAAGWLAYGALDGAVRAIDLVSGETIADLSTERRPILALVRAPGGRFLATGDGEGYITVIDSERWTIERDFRAALRGPIWALAWAPDAAGGPGRLLAGGIADEAALWPVFADSGEGAVLFAGGPRAFHTDPAEMTNGERQFMRKCSICHSLEKGSGRKAGPSLAGVFGRRAGTLKGYRYSEALVSSPIVWTDETIAALFRDGPDVVTPGSKMPVQRIAREADRRDLIDYLRRETGADATDPAQQQ
ncbi:MAG: c-type cytochrome [Pseudomonadota bacterium]